MAALEVANPGFLVTVIRDLFTYLTLSNLSPPRADISTVKHKAVGAVFPLSRSIMNHLKQHCLKGCVSWIYFNYKCAPELKGIE